MNVLILSLNYAPEPVGIGPYSHGMATALAAAGHDVTVVCGKPYYPAWKPDPAYAGGGVRRAQEDGVTVVRVPHYVPAVPSGGKRLLHHVGFALRALPALFAEARRRRPDVVIGVAPSLISVVCARFVAQLMRVPFWLHVQDFEVEAVFATGLLPANGALTRMARWFERQAMAADRASSISPQMCAKLAEKGFARDRIVEFRNWAQIEHIRPLDRPSTLRDEWAIDRPHVALYSGNIANKQGIEIIIAAARRLADRRDLIFVICGNGPNRARLVQEAQGLDNVRFCDLQPIELLPELLGLADVHLLPQIAGAADLVLPSKLANMLASGRPVVATALPGTGLAREVEDVGIVTAPEDADAFAEAIVALLDDPAQRARLGIEARRRAETRWSRATILDRFERDLVQGVTPAATAAATLAVADPVELR
jgi:colanic acid biosynthesis glycosyl transferase WcaI